jgi:hypothetical protein
MISLAKAPLVIPKTRSIKVDGTTVAERQTIGYELETQVYSDVLYLLREITLEETEAQIRLDNQPTRFAVDNRDTKPLSAAQYRTDVIFGNALNKAVISAIERGLREAIRKTTNVDTGRLENIHANWNWIYFVGKGTPGTRINARSLKAFPFGAKLVLRPKLDYVGWANMAVARRGQSFTPSRGKNKGITRTNNQGFMALAISKLKRSPLFKDYTIYISFSKKYRVAGDKYPHGTPSIVLSAKRKRKAYKRT